MDNFYTQKNKGKIPKTMLNEIFWNRGTFSDTNIQLYKSVIKKYWGVWN